MESRSFHIILAVIFLICTASTDQKICENGAHDDSEKTCETEQNKKEGFKLSGLQDFFTPENVKIAKQWLNDNEEKLKVLKNFFPGSPNKNPEAAAVQDQVAGPPQRVQKIGVKRPSQEREDEKARRRQMYAKTHITNDLDYVIHKELDHIDDLINANPKKAHNKYKKLYVEYSSPRALFGMARALNKLAIRTAEKSGKLQQLSAQDLQDIKTQREERHEDEPTELLAPDPDNNVVDQGSKDPNLSRPGRLSVRAEERFREALELQGKAADRFCKILSLKDVPLFLQMAAGRTCVEFRKHRREYDKLIKALKIMMERFPKVLEYPSDLAFQHLLNRRYNKAADLYSEILSKWPRAEKEKCLFGLTLKLLKHQDLDEVSKLLELSAGTKKDDMAKTFLNLATHYQKTGYSYDAERVFEAGVQIGLFLSKWQRSDALAFYMKNLTARPIWSPDQVGVVGDELKEVSKHWEIIRKEGLEALFGHHENFNDKSDELSESGQWQQLVLFEKGQRLQDGCDLVPETCKIIDKYMGGSAARCTRGQVKFSVMQAGTHVWPHSGPTNTRLRAHLGLVVPQEGLVEMRIADKRMRWTEGEFFIIDDSFEHEVWHQGNGIRLVLLIDFWHPEITDAQRATLAPLPNESSEERTTIFRVCGIVSKITDQVTKKGGQTLEAITPPIMSNGIKE